MGAMSLPPKTAILVVIVALLLRLLWSVANWIWVRPKKLERFLRKQGFQGNPYSIFFADMKASRTMVMEARAKPINLSDDILPRVYPYVLRTIQKYGRNAFIWQGPVPSVTIMDPDQIKDVLTKINDFPKPEGNPLGKLLVSGLVAYDGEKWAKHRKIINPAFNLEKLKLMLSTFYESTMDMIGKWETMTSPDRSHELDLWPYLQNLTSDVISRTAFGSSYEEGRRIFELLKEITFMLSKVFQYVYIPGWRFLPLSSIKRMKEIDRDIRTSLKTIIGKREQAMQAGAATADDLLGILLQSNHKEIQEHGNRMDGISVNDVIEECKLFYFAGQETTSSLLVWTMILLSRYPYWQARAREEVLQVFGNQKPDFDGLSHLKIVTMILYEVLRLYPPAIVLNRRVREETKLGNLTLPAGVQVSLPTILVHQDTTLWGDDAKEFNPERFAEGVSKATKGQVAFFPFGWGPRICIGQTFAMLEAKMALALILQRFSFELSPSYSHAPTTFIILQPQHGAHILLRKLE